MPSAVPDTAAQPARAKLPAVGFMQLPSKVKGLQDADAFLTDFDYVLGNSIATEISAAMQNSVMLKVAKQIPELSATISNWEILEAEDSKRINASEYFRRAIEFRLQARDRQKFTEGIEKALLHDNNSAKAAAAQAEGGTRGRSPAQERRGICYDFSDGKCSRGDKCKFLHEKETAQQKKERTASRSRGADATKDNKLKVCKFFTTTGGCRDGENCTWKHVNVDGAVTPTAHKAKAQSGGATITGGVAIASTNINVKIPQITTSIARPVAIQRKGKRNHRSNQSPGVIPSTMALSTGSGGMVFDSGSGKHLAKRSSLNKSEAERIKRCQPIQLHTANGIIVVDECVERQENGLGIIIEALVLDETPEVLSVSNVLDQEGYDLLWCHNSSPMILKNGKIISVLEMENGVPTIAVDELSDDKLNSAQNEFAGFINTGFESLMESPTMGAAATLAQGHGNACSNAAHDPDDRSKEKNKLCAGNRRGNPRRGVTGGSNSAPGQRWIGLQ